MIGNHKRFQRYIMKSSFFFLSITQIISLLYHQKKKEMAFAKTDFVSLGNFVCVCVVYVGL